MLLNGFCFVNNIQKILVPTDLSASSIAALEYGVTLAELYASKLFILNVMDNSSYEIISSTCSVMDELFNSIEKNVISELNQCVKDKVKQDIDEVLSLVRFGIPEKEIVKFAETEKINLIVMTEKSIMYGTERETITMKVIRMTNIPVVTIRSGNYGGKKSNLNLMNIENGNKMLNGMIPVRFTGGFH